MSSDQFVGEIRIFPYTFAPRGWAFCDGQLMPISQNTALYSILGTTYGGNGQTNFALPDLQGRMPLQAGRGPGLSDRWLGEFGGAEQVTLRESEMPSHTHQAFASPKEGNFSSPAGNTWAVPRYGREVERMYSKGPADTTMSPQALAPAGADKAHNNMPPYLTLNFCIALQGIFPPRS